MEHFNAHFAAQSPQQFVENVLWHGLHARWVLVGDDFRFGAKRAGDFAYLQDAGRKFGFDVEQMGSVSEGGIRISSSAVRQALAGEPITVFGDGSQSRSFTDVRDVVGALLKLVVEPRAIGQESGGAAVSQCSNCATGRKPFITQPSHDLYDPSPPHHPAQELPPSPVVHHLHEVVPWSTNA